jgi:hypothetical protein
MAVMMTRLLAATVLAGVLSVSPMAQSPRPAPAALQPLATSGAATADRGDCAQLTQLKLPDMKITDAAAVPAGSGAIRVAHYRVTGVRRWPRPSPRCRGREAARA